MYIYDAKTNKKWYKTNNKLAKASLKKETICFEWTNNGDS